MRRYIIKRLIVSCFTLLVILFILFALLSLMPGSPFNDTKLSLEQVQLLKIKYGLDRPFPERFLRYVSNMLRGDLGLSYTMAPNTSVARLLRTRLPVSVRTGFSAMVTGSLVGLILGFGTALYDAKPVRWFFNIFTILGIAVPSYLIAIGLSYYLGYVHNLLPLLYDFRRPAVSSIMPVVSMSFMIAAVVARFSYSEAVEVMNSDYILLARCQGISKGALMWKYVILNSLMPVITVMASLLVGLLTGSLVIEEMFSIPGIGSLLTNAIVTNDYNVVIALSFVYSLLYIIVMLILDILYCLIDPRVRLYGNKG